MSNYLAIATVTAALHQLLKGPVQKAVTGATVGFKRPDQLNEAKSPPHVNVYLYQVTPNAAYRNSDLPTRRGDGTLVRRVVAALDLHYLLTFYGQDDKLEPQLMLGAVTTTLETEPVLSQSTIQSAITAFPAVKDSDLANQLDRIRITRATLSLEEFSKLWSAFFQVEYRLSVAYQASVVLLENEDTPQEGLPVQTRGIYAATFRKPTITRVMAQAGAGQPILPTSTLVIQGIQLGGDLTSVRIGDKVATPTAVSDKAIWLAIPTDVPAGVLGVQVIQQIAIGHPPKPHSAFESNAVPIVLCPIAVPTLATTTQVQLNVTPTVLPAQRVTLLLNQIQPPSPAPPLAYSFPLPKLGAPSASLSFPVDVQGGGTQYFLRLSVDGAESPLNLDTASPTYGPVVTML